jgi:hypothetical protein
VVLRVEEPRVQAHRRLEGRDGFRGVALLAQDEPETVPSLRHLRVVEDRGFVAVVHDWDDGSVVDW